MAHLSMEMMIPLDVSTNFACSLGPQVDGADQSNQPPTVPAIDSTRQSMPATPFNESIHQLAPFFDGGSRIFLDICSGVSKPLSAALCNRSKTVLAIHLLLHSSMNLLNDEFFEQLLQLYMWIRPCCVLRYCTELWFVFSSSLTTWRSELDGVEGLSAYEAIQLQKVPFCLIVVQNVPALHICRVVTLMLNSLPGPRAGGNHWQQRWMLQSSCNLVLVAACGYGLDIYKNWLFASSYTEFAVTL